MRKSEVIEEKCDFFSEPLYRGYILQKSGVEKEILSENEIILIKEHLKNCKYCSFSVKEMEEIIKIEKAEIDREEIEKSKTRFFKKVYDLMGIIQKQKVSNKILNFFNSYTGFLTYLSIIIILLVIPFFFWHGGITNKESIKAISPEKGGNIVVISPVGSIESKNSVDYKWYPVLSADSYKLYVYDENGNILLCASTKKPEYHMLEEEKIIFTNGGIFYWQVHAIDYDGKVILKSKKIKIVVN